MFNIVIVVVKCIVIGFFFGQFNGVFMFILGVIVIVVVLEQFGVLVVDVFEVIMGCVLLVNFGQVLVCQVVIVVGLLLFIGVIILNKVCGLGMKVIMLGYDLIKVGLVSIVVVGGMELMFNVLYMLFNFCIGNCFGNFQVVDYMVYDGLVNVYDGKVMGEFVECVVDKYQVSCEVQDVYVIELVCCVQVVQVNGVFDDEIVVVIVIICKGEVSVVQDEQFSCLDIVKILILCLVFKKDGMVMVVSLFSIFDGVVVVVLLFEDDVCVCGVQLLVCIVGYVIYFQELEWFIIVLIGVLCILLEKIGWMLDQVDLFEINEVFVVVVMVFMFELGILYDKVNVNGGVCVLGYLIGVLGVWLVVILVNVLCKCGVQCGIVIFCIGGGEVIVIVIELI